MLEIGARLSGRYKIEKVLGQGGMGAVYLGLIESLGNKKVAIKEMEIQAKKEQSKAVHQFQKEATFLAHLDHPNLVKVTDFFTDQDKHYLVMDYIEGQSLQEKLEQGQRPFHWAEVKPWVKPLTDVLGYLHSQEPAILFRDLKPANIMIDPRGRLKLIDFGIARTAQPGTETSTFLKGTGTNGFSPIEQYGMGESTDARSDIYSLGATLYYLMSGKIPPDAVNRVSKGEKLRAITEICPQLPSQLNKVLGKCMALRQAERYTTMEEVGREFDKIEALDTASMETVRSASGLPATAGTGPNITFEIYPSKKKANSQATWAAAFAVVALAAVATASVLVKNVSELMADEPVEPVGVAEKVVLVQERKAPPPQPDLDVINQSFQGSESTQFRPNPGEVTYRANDFRKGKKRPEDSKPITIEWVDIPAEVDKEPAKRPKKKRTSLGGESSYPKAESKRAAENYPRVDQPAPAPPRPNRPKFRRPTDEQIRRHIRKRMENRRRKGR